LLYWYLLFLHRRVFFSRFQYSRIPNPESRIKQEISRGFRLHPRTTPQNGKVAYQKGASIRGAVAFSQIIFASHSMFSIDKVDESFVK